MATLTFSYRSQKDLACLEARLSFRIPGSNLNPKTGKEMPFSYYTRSQIEVEKKFWNEYKKNKKFKDVQKANKKIELDTEIHQLRTHIMNEFNKQNPNNINKEWIKSSLKDYYKAAEPVEERQIPNGLVDYLNYYLKLKDAEMSKALKAKWNTVKNKLLILDELNYKPFKVKEVNDKFKKKFVDFYNEGEYSPITTQRELGFIKTLCRHAATKGVEVSPELATIRLKSEETEKIYLSFEELQTIKDLKNLPTHLDNARDWLLISCYTGQRVSDFMRFNKSMMRIENDIPLLEFTQVKTGTKMVIPVLPQVVEILQKNDGQFPHRISDQKYNKYIKSVCEKANIDKIIKGRLTQNVSKDMNKSKYRKVVGMYPKWKLISSHVGRRSFATNYYGKMPTVYLKNITGHSTEENLITYIGKGKKDLTFDAYQYLTSINQI